MLIAKVKKYIIHCYMNPLNNEMVIAMEKLNFNDLQTLKLINDIVCGMVLINKDIKFQVLHNKLYELIPPFKNIQNLDCYELSAPINAFRQALEAVSKIFDSRADWSLKMTQLFHQEILARKSSISRYMTVNRYQEKKNKAELVQFVSELISHYSRLLVVRVDLFYKLNEHSNEGLTLEDFLSDFKKFRERLHNQHDCFADLHGYAWALEQGTNKALHVHLLLIYNGSKRKNDGGLAILVCKKWESICGEKAASFSCNAKDYKDEYITQGTLGIGMINRNNKLEVYNLLTHVAPYLVIPEKQNQHPVVKLHGMRTFGKALFDKANRRITKTA